MRRFEKQPISIDGSIVTLDVALIRFVGESETGVIYYEKMFLEVERPIHSQVCWHVLPASLLCQYEETLTALFAFPSYVERFKISPVQLLDVSEYDDYIQSVYSS